MRTFAKTLLCGLSAFTLLAAGGAAFAQSATPMKEGAMKEGAMSHGAMTRTHMKVSKSQMRTMKRCMAMGHEKMMANAKCEAMADKHPDMMTSDGMMKSGGMMKK
ncbi:hypothetical protein [Phenylobacterium sp.]|uniref:hypothetical protein n=1 Tax=Phenylobacterium sp. TaxID=1871053 RepID=UPI00286CDC7B|nr:hypothetical protein [Phenylobacterium sp.]